MDALTKLAARRAYSFLMRRVVAVLVLLFATEAHAQYGESITVWRALVDVRVTTASGEPVQGLTADDFFVRIGGKPATVETAEWVDDTGDTTPRDETIDDDVEFSSSSGPARPGGRTLVLFIQTDFARNAARLKGQMNFQFHLVELVRSLPPGDRVAVFSFDSHLKFRSDLTTDRQMTIEAIHASLRIDDPPPPPAVAPPSLAPRLDRKTMKRTTSSEAALLHMANALAHIEGPKSVLLVGWGLGERAGGTVTMKRQWKVARHALDAARATIFALDTTYADHHDLEVGLRIAAAQTGGFYAKTNILAHGAVDRLRRTLSGHYEITLRTDAPLRPGTHAVSIRVDRRGASVLAPTSVIVRP